MTKAVKNGSKVGKSEVVLPAAAQARNAARKAKEAKDAGKTVPTAKKSTKKAPVTKTDIKNVKAKITTPEQLQALVDQKVSNMIDNVDPSEMKNIIEKAAGKTRKHQSTGDKKHEVAKDQIIMELRFDEITVKDGFNPRQEMRDIELLQESIEANGQLDPIHVSWDVDDNTYYILEGHRRFYCLLRMRDEKKLDTLKVKAILNTKAVTPMEKLLFALTSNTNACPFTKLEIADAVVRLTDLDMSEKDISKHLCIRPAQVKHCITLRYAYDDIRNALKEGKISFTIAFKLVEAANGSKKKQSELLYLHLNKIKILPVRDRALIDEYRSQLNMKDSNSVASYEGFMAGMIHCRGAKTVEYYVENSDITTDTGKANGEKLDFVDAKTLGGKKVKKAKA
jgi:ParB/RepB/Spo0J family partition protein